MNADYTFQIGHDHTVCEDYSLAEVKADFAYAIVCDGCSASPDVDFGARVLALAAKNTLLRVDLSKCHEDIHNFGNAAILCADRIYAIFPRLHPQALDATLLVSFVYDKKFTALMYGDGVVVHKHKNGMCVHHAQLTSNAPDYLSYSMDKSRMEEYLKLQDNNKEVIYRKEDGTYDMIIKKPFDPVIIQLPVEEGDVIAVISDGINSFRNTDNTSVDWKTLIDEFIGFKTTTGQFVQRRIKAFKKKCQQEGITHSDDISIASIVV